MIDFKEVPSKDDTWELFSRDFLEEIGFFIESPPDRGADGGKDLLITEEIKGKLHRDRFRWLVSCKHFAHSQKAVNENDHERNILERVRSFKADGFIGFYSTLASSGLNNRLRQLKNEKSIRDYRIFDHRMIENHLLTKGFSRIMFRYFPESYKKVRPIHNVIDKYVSLECDNCGKDILEALYSEEYQAVVASVTKIDENRKYQIIETYFACKGKCDEKLSQRAWQKYHETTAWKDISDLAMPNDFLRWILTTINQLSDDYHVYSESALKKEKHLIMALSQKIFREVTDKERARFRDLVTYGI
jgi:hypothetical protein